jgi:hypothetical protein
MKMMNKKGGIIDGFMILMLIILVIVIAIMESGKTCQYEEDIEKIYSLNMGKEMEGSFFIGVGGFGHTTYYYFYKEDGEGIILDKVNAEYVRLIETNDKVPSYVEYSCNCTFKKCDGSKKRTLFIPIGTVKTNYDIDTRSLRGG